MFVIFYILILCNGWCSQGDEVTFSDGDEWSHPVHERKKKTFLADFNTPKSFCKVSFEVGFDRVICNFGKERLVCEIPHEDIMREDRCSATAFSVSFPDLSKKEDSFFTYARRAVVRGTRCGDQAVLDIIPPRALSYESVYNFFILSAGAPEHVCLYKATSEGLTIMRTLTGSAKERQNYVQIAINYQALDQPVVSWGLRLVDDDTKQHTAYKENEKKITFHSQAIQHEWNALGEDFDMSVALQNGRHDLSFEEKQDIAARWSQQRKFSCVMPHIKAQEFGVLAKMRAACCCTQGCCDQSVSNGVVMSCPVDDAMGRILIIPPGIKAKKQEWCYYLANLKVRPLVFGDYFVGESVGEYTRYICEYKDGTRIFLQVDIACAHLGTAVVSWGTQDSGGIKSVVGECTFDFPLCVKKNIRSARKH